MLISSEFLELKHSKLKEQEVCKQKEEKKILADPLKSQYPGMVIDMKREYNNKTKEKLASILIKDIIQNQTDRYNVFELSRRMDRVKFTLNIEENEDSSYSKRNNSLRD